MIGTRGRLPLNGEAGGAPGAVTGFAIKDAQGNRRSVAMAGADVVVAAGERFEVKSASAGGWGDPLSRPAEEVVLDLQCGRISLQEAEDVYGLVMDAGAPDDDATARRRSALALDRLARSIRPEPARVPTDVSQDSFPIYPGIVQRGRYAQASSSGAILACAPQHWTEGCAILEEDDGGVTIRSYLDPLTGTALLVEAVPTGSVRSFSTLPARWTEAA